MMSTINFIYDALDFVSPFIFSGRKIIQRLCQLNVKWGEKKRIKNWKDWESLLKILGNITVKRSLKPSSSKSVKEVTFHILSNAFEEGYGHVFCLTTVDTENQFIVTV